MVTRGDCVNYRRESIYRRDYVKYLYRWVNINYLSGILVTISG